MPEMRATDDPIHVLYVGDEPSVVASSLEREDERFDVAAVTTADEGMTRLVDPAVDCVVAGTGFGLNIVREIAEAHGWEVRLTESEAGGVRFEFTDLDG